MTEIQSAPASTNPVARWVESVQPWMPGSDGDEAMADNDDTPDWTARSKGESSKKILLWIHELTIISPGVFVTHA